MDLKKISIHCKTVEEFEKVLNFYKRKGFKIEDYIRHII